MRKRKTNKVDKVFESIFVIIKDFVVIKNIEKILEDCSSLSNYIILLNCVNVESLRFHRQLNVSLYSVPSISM